MSSLSTICAGHRLQRAWSKKTLEPGSDGGRRREWVDTSGRYLLFEQSRCKSLGRYGRWPRAREILGNHCKSGQGLTRLVCDVCEVQMKAHLPTGRRAGPVQTSSTDSGVANNSLGMCEPMTRQGSHVRQSNCRQHQSNAAMPRFHV